MRQRRGRGQRSAALRIAPSLACPTCQRPLEECFCAKVRSLPTTTEILILQHPREQYKLAGSARLAQATLQGSQLRVGLSWANLGAALGKAATASDWAVLTLRGKKPKGGEPFQLFDRKDQPLERAAAPQGLIVLDGSWQQAKTLWWRNAWLLKLNRAVLDPDHPSLRPQVRAVGLSTIEALAFALASLGEDQAVVEELRRQYVELVLRPWQAQASRPQPDEDPPS